MYRYFENLVDPFPTDDGKTPPKGLFAFLYYYSRPVLPWLILMGVLTGALSVIEIVFVTFTGSLVDWLANADRATFFSQYGWELGLMAVLIVVVFPLLALGASLLQFQTTFGVYPMLVRWKAHRFMLGQSLNFFQD